MKYFVFFFILSHFFYFTAQNSFEKKYKTSIEKGIINYRQGNLDLAESQLNSALKAALNAGDVSNSIKASTNLGNVFADKAENSKALFCYQRALKMAIQTSDSNQIAHLNKNIGTLFVSMKRFEESLFYYYLAEKQAILLNDELLIADCNNNIGIVLEQQGEFLSAERKYTKALNWYLKNDDLSGVGMVYSNLAIVYKLQKKYDRAIAFYKKSLNISRQSKDQWAQAATLNNIGNLYGEINQYKLALQFCEESLAISKTIKAPEISIMTYESMANAAAINSSYKDAFRFQKMYDKAKSKFDNVENNRALSKLNIQFNSERKQKQNELLQAENKLRITEVEKANRQRNLWIISSLFFIAVVLFVSKLMRINAKSKQKIIQQQLINTASFHTEQSERERIARDLHDSVGQKLAVVKMQLSMIENEDSKAASNLLDQAIQDVREVSHNLMPVELKDGLILALEELTSQINYSTEITHVELVISPLVEDIELSIQTEVYLYRIVQEVLTNALKYAQAKKIQINLKSTNLGIELSIHDDGVGFETTQINASQGIGFKNIRSRISQLNGTFKFHSEKQKGSFFNIFIPS